MNIEELDLSVRAYNCLKRAGINTVEQVCQMSAWELSKIRNMGNRSMEEIRDKVLAAGYDAFGMKGKAPSHGDEIRRMDDEELADFFLGIDMNAADGSLVIDGEYIKPDRTCILEWLRSKGGNRSHEENTNALLPY